MKIVVLNGSPKGEISVTMQYVRFLQKRFPEHEMTILNICQESRRLEEDPESFSATIKTIESADAVLWATPVYVLLVPGPYKRFVELVVGRSAQAAFEDRYAAIFTTSVRFFDHTAHAYLHAVSEDLGMRVVGVYSAEMYDLVKEEERKRLTAFWTGILAAAKERAPTQRRFRPLEQGRFTYESSKAQAKITTGGKRVVLVTDAEQGSNLQGMVTKVCGCFSEPIEVVNLNEIKMLGGCMGCIHCGLDNVCVYRDADDVFGVYQKLMAADIVIKAATIKDRFLSARWKTFWDRGFFNNHIPILVGKQIGYLLSGPLRQLPHLREVLETSAELQRANLVGIVTDECDDSQELDELLERFAGRLVQCDQEGYIHPPTFFGKAGRKLLRDEIWASLRFVFPQDHAYYKRNGLYDFPRRSIGTRVREAFFRLMLRFPGFREEFRRRIKTEMIRPLEKVVEES